MAHSAETRKKLSLAAKRQWLRPTTRSKMVAAISDAWNRPGYRQKLKAKFREQRGTIEYRTKQGALVKKAMARPEVRQKIRRISKDPTYRLKLSLAQKKAYAEGRRKVTVSAANKTRISAFEKALCIELRSRGLRVVVQHKLVPTRFIGDLYLPLYDLVIEVDGHPSHYTEEGQLRMKMRDTLVRQSYRIKHLGQKALRRGVKYCASLVLRDLKGSHD